MKKATLVLAVALGLCCVLASNAAAAVDCSFVRDNFDRANSTTLGSLWTEQATPNNIGIESLRATNPTASTALATFKNGTGNQACADVSTNGTGVQYVAIVLGYKNLTNNLFIKVQQNNGAGFNIAYFYYGNNGTSFSPSVNLTPFANAQISASLVGSTVTLTVDTNFDGIPEETLTAPLPATASLGTGIGLGIYGHALADDFATAKPAKPPNQFTFGKLTRNTHRGTATLPVNLPGPGTLSLGGTGVKPQRIGGATASMNVTAGGTVNLKIKAKGKARKTLHKTGKVKLKLSITYTPKGGSANTQTKRVKLIKHH